MLAFIFTVLGIIFMFSPIIFMGKYGVSRYYFFPFTLILGGIFIAIVWVVHFYLKNKKMDETFEKKDFEVEENPSQKKITDEDKYYILDNLEEFEERIGVGKKYYISSFLKRKTPFNYAAFFGGFLWLGYRGLLKEIVYLLVVFTLADILGMMIGINIENMGMIVSIVIGIFANQLYFAKLKRDIENNKQKLKPALGVIFAMFLFIVYLVITDH